MKKLRFVQCACGLLFGVSVAMFARNTHAAEGSPASKEEFRAAILYSDSGKKNRHRDEFDGTMGNLGWAAEKYPLSRVNELIDNLGRYDVVIASPLYWVKEKGDKTDVFGVAGKKWREFIEQGGALVITDANYPETVSWLEKIAPSFKAASNGGKVDSEAPRERAPRHPIHSLPNELSASANPFGHLILDASNDWEVVTWNGIGKPIEAFQRLGKGFVYISSLRLANPKYHENVRANLEILRSGILPERFEIPPITPGKETLSLDLRSLAENSKVPATLELIAEPKSGKPVTFSREVSLPAGKTTTLQLPYHLQMRGPASLTLKLTAAGKSAVLLRRDVVLPDLLEIKSSRYRGLVSEARRSEELKVNVHLAPDEEKLDELKVATRILTAEGKPKGAVHEMQVPGRDFKVSLPFGKAEFPAGEYVVRTKLLDGEKVLAEKDAKLKVLKVSPGQTVIDDDMVALVDGKPFFPIGFYHVSKEDLPVVAALGANAVQGWNWGNLKNTTEYLDVAKSLGIKVILETGGLLSYSEDKLIATIEAFKKHPALLAWYLVDEPGEGIYPKVEALKSWFDEADPNHPTYMVSFRPRLFSREQEFADIFAVDPYLHWLPENEFRPSTKVSDWTKWAWSATKGDKPVWLVPESFGFAPRNVYPITTYLSIIHQAKGIVWYPWDDPKVGGQYSGLKYYPGLYPIFQQLAAELKVLSPGLLDGDLRTFVEGDFHGLVIEHEAGNYLILANASLEPENAKLEVPELKGLSELAEAFDEGKLPVFDGTVTLAFQPYEVKVFRWNGRK